MDTENKYHKVKILAEDWKDRKTWRKERQQPS